MRLTRRVRPPYFDQVASAKEALEVATSTVTMFGGKLNLSKEEAVYPPFTRVFWSLNSFWDRGYTWS